MIRLIGLLVAATCACVTFVPTPSIGQVVREHSAGQTRSLHGGAKQVRRSFRSDSEALQLFEEVLRAAGLAGLEDRIELRASAETDNAVAFIDGSKRYIAYNAVYMQRMLEKKGDYWPLLAILAHEIGHHVRFHTQIDGRNHEFELEADYQAGFILRRMGANLDQALAVFRTFPKEATIWHPGRGERLQMVTIGWRDGGKGSDAERAGSVSAGGAQEFQSPDFDLRDFSGVLSCRDEGSRRPILDGQFFDGVPIKFTVLGTSESKPWIGSSTDEILTPKKIELKTTSSSEKGDVLLRVTIEKLNKDIRVEMFDVNKERSIRRYLCRPK